MIHVRIAIAAAALAVEVLLGPGAGTALAQTPAASAYRGNLGQTDLGGLAGTGVVLIGAGALLRSRTARRT
jgi:hypothetical protein